MAVLYESEHATIHLADSRKVLPTLGADTIDLLVVDPPYGVEWQSNKRADKFDQLRGDGAGDRSLVADIIAGSITCTRPFRHMYVFGPADALEGQKVRSIAQMIWDKSMLGMGDLSLPWGASHEELWFAVVKGSRKTDGALPARMRRGTVLKFQRPNSRQVRHPSEKPVPLLRELIESSSRPGETVLDPCAGIGSTGVAAILSGRKAILIERDAKYALMARDRVRAAEAVVAQMIGL